MTVARLGTHSSIARAALVVLASMVATFGPSGCATANMAPTDGALPYDAGEPPDAGGPIVEPEEGDLCYDEIDNDLDGLADCDELSCREDPSCCVSSGRAECCAAIGRSVVLPLDRCADGPARVCFGSNSALRLFGTAEPIIENGALVPQGGPRHGGVVLGPAIDARAANLVIEATIEAPSGRCGDDCVDGAGIAILDHVPANGGNAVARFGILVVGSRDEVVVWVAGEPVARAPIPAVRASYRLELDVEGNARAYAGTTKLASIAALELPSEAFVAVFGRTQNRAPDQRAVGVRAASVTTYDCDVPSALVRRAAPVVPWSEATWDPQAVRRPSVVHWDADGRRHVLMAFAHDDRIHLAERTGFGEFRHASFDPGPPTFDLPAGMVAARDPWLVVDASRLVLWFTGIAEDGRTAIWRALGGPGHAQVFGAPERSLDPVALGFDGIDGPSVVRDGSVWTMVARVHQGASHRFVRFLSTNEGATWALDGESAPEATVREPRGHDLFAFDRDEIAAPALVAVTDALGRRTHRLYYAGRRGTQWSIGLLASRDMRHWVSTGAVLGPGDAFDMLGVADPAPHVEEGILRLYYAGTDGTRWRIGVSGPREAIEP